MPDSSFVQFWYKKYIKSGLDSTSVLPTKMRERVSCDSASTNCSGWMDLSTCMYAQCSIIHSWFSPKKDQFLTEISHCQLRSTLVRMDGICRRKHVWHQTFSLYTYLERVIDMAAYIKHFCIGVDKNENVLGRFCVMNNLRVFLRAQWVTQTRTKKQLRNSIQLYCEICP